MDKETTSTHRNYTKYREDIQVEQEYDQNSGAN